jgi:hypothetical protein
MEDLLTRLLLMPILTSQCVSCALKRAIPYIISIKRFDSTFKKPPPRPSPKQQFNQYQPQSHSQALIVQPGQVLPDAWYLDTGASAHVTHDVNDFTSHTPYTGADHHCVGHSKDLIILNIEFGVLRTVSTPLLLHNILYVSAISKLLLSISQLFTDNKVYVEFNINSYLIKDQASRQVLIKGIRHNDL